MGGLVLFCCPLFFGGRHHIDSNAGNMTWALNLTTIHLTLEKIFWRVRCLLIRLATV